MSYIIDKSNLYKLLDQLKTSVYFEFTNLITLVSNYTEYPLELIKLLVDIGAINIEITKGIEDMHLVVYTVNI